MLWLKAILVYLPSSHKSAWLPKGKANDFVTGFIYLEKDLWILCQQHMHTFLPPLCPPFWSYSGILEWCAKLEGIGLINSLLSLGILTSTSPWLLIFLFSGASKIFRAWPTTLLALTHHWAPHAGFLFSWLPGWVCSVLGRMWLIKGFRQNPQVLFKFFLLIGSLLPVSHYPDFSSNLKNEFSPHKTLLDDM